MNKITTEKIIKKLRKEYKDNIDIPNVVAIRNQQNINISELIVGTFIITTGLVVLIILGIKNSISLEDVTHLIFNTILGIVHISDAKEKWRFN